MGFYGNATYYLPNGIAQDVAKGVITTEKLAEDAVTAEKVSPKAIQGSKGTKLDDNNNHSSHIATKTIGGGKNGDIAFDTITGGSEAGKGNIAGGTIQNYNIKNGTIGKEKLNTTYLETKIDSHQSTISNIDQLFAFCNKTISDNQLSRIYINQEIKWPNNENFDIVIIPAYYLTIKFSMWTILLDTNQGKFYQIEKNDTQITNIKTTKLEGYQNIINDTITGGSAVGEGNIAGGTIKGYNIDKNTIKGSYKAPGEDDMSSSHLGEYTIGRTNLGNKIITASKVADTAIYGKENAYGWQHIATESIAGGENGDIAENTIQQYNMADDSVGIDQIINNSIFPMKLSKEFFEFLGGPLNDIESIIKMENCTNNTDGSMMHYALGIWKNLSSSIHNNNDYDIKGLELLTENSGTMFVIRFQDDWSIFKSDGSQYHMTKKDDTYTITRCQLNNDDIANDFYEYLQLPTNNDEMTIEELINNYLLSQPFNSIYCGRLSLNGLPSGRYMIFKILANQWFLINCTNGAQFQLKNDIVNETINIDSLNWEKGSAIPWTSNFAGLGTWTKKDQLSYCTINKDSSLEDWNSEEHLQDADITYPKKGRYLMIMTTHNPIGQGSDILTRTLIGLDNKFQYSINYNTSNGSYFTNELKDSLNNEYLQANLSNVRFYNNETINEIADVLNNNGRYFMNFYIGANGVLENGKIILPAGLYFKMPDLTNAPGATITKLNHTIMHSSGQVYFLQYSWTLQKYQVIEHGSKYDWATSSVLHSYEISSSGPAGQSYVTANSSIKLQNYTNYDFASISLKAAGEYYDSPSSYTDQLSIIVPQEFNRECNIYCHLIDDGGQACIINKTGQTVSVLLNGVLPFEVGAGENIIDNNKLQSLSQTETVDINNFNFKIHVETTPDQKLIFTVSPYYV